MTMKRIYQQQELSDNNTSSSSSVSLTISESTPLLIQTNTNNKQRHLTTRKEFKWLFLNSLPIVGTYLLQNSFQLTSIFTLGHLGPVELGAAALASMFVNVSAWSVAYVKHGTASPDKTMIGIYLQRAYLILSLVYIPIACVWWRAASIMLYFQQDPQLAHYAGLFLRYLLPGAPAYMAFEATKRYLQAQGIMHASTFAMMIAAPLNFILNIWFVSLWGFLGAPLATSFSYWLMFIFLLIYIQYVQGSEGWGGWTRACLSGWLPFLKLALHGIIIICAEWTAFEISSLAASYLGSIDLAAQSVLLTISSTTYAVSMGISVATTNRVGNQLGAQRGDNASRSSFTALIVAALSGIIHSIFYLGSRRWLGRLFSSNTDVVDKVAAVLPLVAFFQVADGIASVGGGIIRGLGRTHVAAWINLVAYYGVALPFGFLATFKWGWQLIGLWIGLSIALFLVALSEIVYLYSVDWKIEVKRAQERCKQG
ncbi:mate-domain-containing protein [Cokeromyces recurvatus]|uniref:mate-domain-containing protein n=1 Tax=Cokeromyces recurvatus TaxID=90255 RepID=UPI00221E44D0|nr:mate-domain-containing protein [Cokeromyces recurvatus]KAI7899169.1 mate-domain-containing protein [Cokeromyces recurvatus]